ncbi:MAG: hypothetical protein ACHREM_10670 [Polyangiales bacterium]
MDTDISSRIEAIIEARRAQLGPLRAQLQRWSALTDSLQELEGSIRVLVDSPTTPAELKETASSGEFAEMARRASSAIGDLRRLEQRFQRPSINLGVSGQARVGKSTLLQTISGLGDQQIPTGDNVPVTAVRSRISHNTVHRRATLTLHTHESFLANVVEPYHRQIGLPAPTSIGEFASRKYPSKTDLPEVSTLDKDQQGVLLSRLKSMQASLPSYQAQLTGGNNVVALEELRDFVAYPAYRDGAESTHRPYLAVRDAFIECSFPLTQVNDLVLIDLPGLGEIAADAEEHHVQGLQNEVDLVLFVKRPVTGMGYWKREDAAALALLQKARGEAHRSGDFVLFVVNGVASADATKALVNSLEESLNERNPGRFYQLLVADACDKASVYERVMGPVLRHLAEKLPLMDRQIADVIQARAAAEARAISSSLDAYAQLLKAKLPERADVRELVDERTEELHRKLASDFAQVVEELFQLARGDVEDEAFITAVDQAAQLLDVWVESAFGSGADAWKTTALDTIRRDHGSGELVDRELNRIRVEISNRFCSVDAALARQVDAVLERFASVFSSRFGELPGPGSARERLTRLAVAMDEALTPCPRLAAAIRELLAFRVEYRTQLHPRVRRTLDMLQPQVRDADTGQMRPLETIGMTDGDVDAGLRRLVIHAQRAVYETKTALYREVMVPSLILHAASEQFDDAFIRSGDSKRELKRLTHAYRDEIWPAQFKDVSIRNAAVNRVLRAAAAATQHADALSKQEVKS